MLFLQLLASAITTLVDEAWANQSTVWESMTDNWEDYT